MTPPSPKDPKGGPLLTEEALRLLEEYHHFPGPYTFKIIGYAADGFVEAVKAAAETVMGPLPPGQHPTWRPSRGNRYYSVTLEMEMTGARQVLDVYAALRELEGLVVLV